MSSAEPGTGSQPRPAALPPPLIARPWLRPLAWLLLQSLLLLLGLMSIGWNLVALALLPVLDRERGRRVGRRGISRGYALFWRAARASTLRASAPGPLEPAPSRMRRPSSVKISPSSFSPERRGSGGSTHLAPLRTAYAPRARS